MKRAIFLILCSVCVLSGAESLVLEKEKALSVEQRRGGAMGKQLGQFETMAGRIYRDVQITKISDAGISFSHADGTARLRFDDLTPEQWSYFGINEEDADAIYLREMKAREAYENKVEEREKVRRELAQIEAAERAEAQWLAMQKAERERTAVAEIQPTERIPLYPTIKRVDTVRRSFRHYSSYRPYYGGYGCPVRYNYGWRSSHGDYFGTTRGHCGSRTPGFLIRW